MPPRCSQLALPLCLLALSLPAAAYAVGTALPRNTGSHIEPDEPPEGFYWGSIDANIDWCEKNYTVTPYVAELWNALSSLPICK
jgi:hypothetical protein